MSVEVDAERRGFFPKGGGLVTVGCDTLRRGAHAEPSASRSCMLSLLLQPRSREHTLVARLSEPLCWFFCTVCSTSLLCWAGAYHGWWAWESLLLTFKHNERSPTASLHPLPVLKPFFSPS